MQKNILRSPERFQETVKGTSLDPLFYFYRSLAIADSSINASVKAANFKTSKERH
jgi:hypothetical protein